MLTSIMMLVLIFLLIAMWFKLRRVSFSLAILLLLSIFLSGSGLITRPVLISLQKTPKADLSWKDSNLLIVLGSGTVRISGSEELIMSLPGMPRVLKAAHMYFDCKKSQRVCKILATGGDPLKNGSSEAAVIAKALTNLNIPDTDIIIEDKSTNTFLNAKFTRDYLQEIDTFEKFYLITSGTHLNRSLLYFEHFGITAAGIPSDYLKTDFSLLPKSSNVYLLDMALHEYIGVLRYHFYNYMEWNEPKIINE